MFLYFGLFSCKSQIYPIEGRVPSSTIEGMIFKDTNNNFDKFEGTWEYSDATSRFRLVLQKIEDYEDLGYVSDVIVGNIIYEENGVEVINTLTNPSTSQGSDDIYHIDMFDIRDSTYIRGFFEDPIRSKWTTYALRLKFSEVNDISLGLIQQLEWSVVIREFYNPNGDLGAKQALRVPKNIILTKV